MRSWSQLRWVWLLYLTAAAGYGGWSGQNFASGEGLWIILFLPAAVVLASSLWRWNRNRPSWQMAFFGLSVPTLLALCVGAMTLVIAWGIAETTADWSSPLLRAIVGAGVAIVTCSLILFAYSERSPATKHSSLAEHE